MSKLSVSIVTFNAAHDVPPLLASLEKALSGIDAEIFFVDNASTDTTVTLLQQWKTTTPLQHISITPLQKNIGFGSGHNVALRNATGTYVAVLNQDIVLAPDYFSACLAALDAQPALGSVQGKILQWGNEPADTIMHKQDHVLDTTGLVFTKAFRFFDRGAGEKDNGQYDTATAIFGPAGVAAVYRKEALDQIIEHTDTAQPPAYFDEHFFMNKEDIDMAWRLQHAGWASAYVPIAQAWHHRGFSGSTHKRTILATVFSRRHKSPLSRYESFKNHHLMLKKNLSAGIAKKWWLHILWYELQSVGFALLTESSAWRALAYLWRHRKDIQIQRQQIQKRGTLTSEDYERFACS